MKRAIIAALMCSLMVGTALAKDGYEGGYECDSKYARQTVDFGFRYGKGLTVPNTRYVTIMGNLDRGDGLRKVVSM